MFYLVAMCIGFFGGFFLGYGLSGPAPEKSAIEAEQMDAGTSMRERELLRQLASSQPSCGAPASLEPQTKEAERLPASLPYSEPEELVSEPYQYEIPQDREEESRGWESAPQDQGEYEEEP